MNGIREQRQTEAFGVCFVLSFLVNVRHFFAVAMQFREFSMRFLIAAVFAADAHATTTSIYKFMDYILTYFSVPSRECSSVGPAIY